MNYDKIKKMVEENINEIIKLAVKNWGDNCDGVVTFEDDGNFEGHCLTSGSWTGKEEIYRLKSHQGYGLGRENILDDDEWNDLCKKIKEKYDCQDMEEAESIADYEDQEHLNLISVSYAERLLYFLLENKEYIKDEIIADIEQQEMY